jgi:hypothetical protein
MSRYFDEQIKMMNMTDIILDKCYRLALCEMVEDGWQLSEIAAGLQTIGAGLIVKGARVLKNIRPDSGEFIAENFSNAMLILNNEIERIVNED